MKVSKRQLRKIIREERARLLKEQLTDDTAWQDFLVGLARQVSERFGNDMLTLIDEDPEAFEGRSTRDEWYEQVHNAQLELDTGLVTAMEEYIAEVENMLHDGQYSDRGRGMG